MSNTPQSSSLIAHRPSGPPTKGHTALVVVGIILGLLILGGIAGVVYVLVSNGVISIVASSAQADADAVVVDDEEVVHVGEFVYLTATDASLIQRWLHIDTDVDENGVYDTYMTSDASAATVFNVVPTPGIQSAYEATTGDQLMFQSYGLKEFGNDKTDAAGKITLQVQNTNIYITDSNSSSNCYYMGNVVNDDSIIGLALVPSDTTDDAGYYWVDPNGDPPTNTEITAGTTGRSSPTAQFVTYGATFKIRPSYTLTSSRTTNVCGGHPMKMSHTMGETETRLLGWSDDSVWEDGVFSFERATV